MSSTMATSPVPISSGDKKDKSSKKSKRDKSKKRDREPDAVDGSERKTKKPKKADDAQDGANSPAEVTHKKEKKEKKRRRHAAEANEEETAEATDNVAGLELNADADAAISKEEKKKRKKRERKSKDHNEIMATHSAVTAEEEPELMEIDSTPAKKSNSRARTATSDKQYPFFTQTVSLYLPLYPAGMTEPLEGYAGQHLKPLVNRYVPDLKGVLLGYRNPRLGERPGAKSLTENSGAEDIALLESINEYAVAYGWFTAEVDLFRPARGAWMEGTMNLQSEGFVGVICFDMFNASIEAKRLPKGWRWVDLMSKKGKGKTAEETRLPTPDPFDESTNGANGEEAADQTQTQLHTTGYWVDETGARVTGKLQFRIKNYEVGSSDTHGYLSIEGTMLDEEAEKARILEEREEARRRKKRLAGGYLRSQIKRVPDFSTTKFATQEEEEDESQRATQWKASRPGSETE